MPNDILFKTFKTIQQQYGYNVLLQRRVFDDGVGIYSLPAPDEDFFSKKLERWTVYSTFAGRKTGITSIQEERAEGLVHTLKIVFFFPADAKPKEGDRIYQPDDRYPPGNFVTYLIEASLPVRGKGGLIVYYEAGAIREDPK